MDIPSDDHENPHQQSLSGSGFAVLIEIDALKLGGVSKVKITEEHKLLSTGLVVHEGEARTLDMVGTELHSRQKIGADANAVCWWGQELQLMALKIVRLKQVADQMKENNRIKRLSNLPIDNLQEEHVICDLAAATAAMDDFVTKYPTLDAYRKLLLQRKKEQETNSVRT